MALGLAALAAVAGFLMLNQSYEYALLSFGFAAGFFAFVVLNLLPSKNNADADDAISLAHLYDGINSLKDGLIIYDENDRIIVTNERIKEFFRGLDIDFSRGAKRTDIGRIILEWFPEGKERSKLAAYYERLRANDGINISPLEIKTPDGKIILFSERKTKENCRVTVIVEVTEQKKQQKQLTKSTDLLATVYENIPLGICIFDENACIVDWNEKYLELMEVEPEKIYPGLSLEENTRNLYDKFDPQGEDIEEYFSNMISRIKSLNANRLDRRFKSGKIVEIIRTNLPQGGFVCTYKDITLEKSTQELLKESENRYRKMVELSPDGIIVHKDGIIIYANTAAIRLLEAKDLHSIVGDKIQKYFPVVDHDKLDDHFGGADRFQPGDIVPIERSQVIGKYGNRINVELEASALLYGDKPVMQLIARDISAQTRAHELLEKAKEEAESAARIKGTFLANMSHELRTPLNAVIGFSEIIKNEIYGKIGSQKYIEYASDIHSSGKHLLQLINEILDLSKIEMGAQKLHEERVDLAEIVDECMRITTPQKDAGNVLVVSHLSPVLPAVVADEKMIKQVVLNLLSNAIKFTPNGGTVSITGVIGRDGGIEMSVEDNGIGIKEEDIAKALTPFVQVDSEMNRKYQGTGLGLPLSKNLMELHSGSLDVTSMYGSGTTVTIRLPKERVERSAA